MLCVASVRIGPARQAFWAVWDRPPAGCTSGRRSARGAVELSPGGARLADARASSSSSRSTRPPGSRRSAPAATATPGRASRAASRPAAGSRSTARRRPVEARAVIDDTAAYYQRHTALALVAPASGTAADGRALAWNLVAGRQRPAARQRAHRVDRRRAARAGAGHLRRRPRPASASCASPPRPPASSRENLVLIRSRYRQPFGTFSGALPGGVALAEGFGVMEDARRLLVSPASRSAGARPAGGAARPAAAWSASRRSARAAAAAPEEMISTARSTSTSPASRSSSTATSSRDQRLQRLAVAQRVVHREADRLLVAAGAKARDRLDDRHVVGVVAARVRASAPRAPRAGRARCAGRRRCRARARARRARSPAPRSPARGSGPRARSPGRRAPGPRPSPRGSPAAA